MRKTRFDRLKKIKTIITLNGPIKFEEIREEIRKEFKDIGERALYKDLKYLKEKGINGTPLNIQFENGYTLDKTESIWADTDLNQNQKEAFPIVLSILEPYKNAPAVANLVSELEKKTSIKSNMVKDILVHSNNKAQKYSDSFLQLILTISNYIQNNQACHYNYSSVRSEIEIGKSKTKEEKVYPLQIRVYNFRYYLVAIPVEEDFKRENIKTYAIDRIYEHKADLLMDVKEENILTFDREKTLEELNLNELFSHCMGGIMLPKKDPKAPKPPRPITIKRWFKSWAASLILEVPLHHSQERIKLEGDKVLIEYTVYDTPEVDYAFGSYREYSWANGDKEPK